MIHTLKHSKLLGFCVKAGLTFAAFWFALRDIDFQYVVEILKNQDHFMLLAAGALIVLQLTVGAIRWRLIMKALADSGVHVISVRELARIFYISLFFVSCLPGTVGGDVVRVWMAKSDKVPMTLSIHSVIIDRVIALAALALMVIGTLPMLSGMLGFNLFLVLGLSVVVLAAGLWFLFAVDRLLAPVKHIRPVHWLLYFANSLRMIIVKPWALATSIIYAVFSHVCFCMSAWVLAHSLDIAMTPAQAIALIPPVMLATVLPLSIGGWGVREAGMVGMLGLIGISQNSALILSVQLGLIGIAISLPAGLLWLLSRKKNSTV